MKSVQQRKKWIAEAFSQAVNTYDSAARFQQKTGRYLLSKLSEQDQHKCIVDLGCGTGFLSTQLDQSPVICIDIAKSPLTRITPPAQPICADIEQLPLRSRSVDIALSNMALHWCDDLALAMTEIKRILKPGGKMMVNILGEQTFHEIRQAWAHVDNNPHVNRYPTKSTITHALNTAGLTIIGMEESVETTFFETANDFLHYIKAIGAPNRHSDRQRGLMTKKQLNVFKSAYELQRTNNGLPLTYELYTLECKT